MGARGSYSDFNSKMMTSEMRVRVAQIIAMALIVGVLAMFAITYTTNWGGGSPNTLINIAGFEIGVISLMAGLTVGLIPLGLFVICPAIEKGAVKNQAKHAASSVPGYTDDDQLGGIWFITFTISMAFTESVAIMGTIAFMIEKQSWVLAVIALGWAVMLFLFPTQDRYQQWIEARKNDLR